MSSDEATRNIENLEPRRHRAPRAGLPRSVRHRCAVRGCKRRDAKSGEFDDTVMAVLPGQQLEIVRVLLLRLQAACPTDLPLLLSLRLVRCSRLHGPFGDVRSD